MEHKFFEDSRGCFVLSLKMFFLRLTEDSGCLGSVLDYPHCECNSLEKDNGNMIASASDVISGKLG